jgi:outer membrane protein, multidrug efflux system
VDVEKSACGVATANYRQTVLTAFQQVEDGLSGLRVLSDAAKTQDAAVAASQDYLRIANNRYVGGITTYLDVIPAQETLLNNQRLATQLLGQRLVTSVFLVRALGGGWDASNLNAVPVHPSWRQAIEQ